LLRRDHVTTVLSGRHGNGKELPASLASRGGKNT
jgi:hypothetical protein